MIAVDGAPSPFPCPYCGHLVGSTRDRSGIWHEVVHVCHAVPMSATVRRQRAALAALHDDPSEVGWAALIALLADRQ